MRRAPLAVRTRRSLPRGRCGTGSTPKNKPHAGGVSTRRRALRVTPKTFAATAPRRASIEESFSFQWGGATVGELFERIRTLMPSDRPNSLSSQAYRDVVAFILQSNTFPPGPKELDADPDALRQILIVVTRPEPGSPW